MSRKSKSRFGRPSKHVKESVAIEVGSEDDLRDRIAEIESPFVLVLDGVQDPHNLGACLRTADAAGVDAVVTPRDRAVSITDTVINIASGAAAHVPLYQVTNLAQTMRDLKEANLWLVGTADDAEQTLYDIDLRGPLCIVMGAEGKGLRRLTRETCDFLANIPMYGSVDCLNVSVATGVCLFEAVRQRKLTNASDSR